MFGVFLIVIIFWMPNERRRIFPSTIEVKAESADLSELFSSKLSKSLLELESETFSRLFIPYRTSYEVAATSDILTFLA